MPRIAALAFVLLIPRALAGTRFNTFDDEAMKAFSLTTENVRKAAAVMHRLAGEVAKDPALAPALGKKTQRAATLDAKAKALESDPRIASALRAEPITAREYVMVQLAILQAGLIAAARARGAEMDPAEIAEAMNPANVDFVETHPKEMEELGRSQRELENATKPADRSHEPTSAQGEKK
jgi:hypothetical protein